MFQYLPPKKICCASIVFISLIFTSSYTYVQQQPKKDSFNSRFQATEKGEKFVIK